MSYYFTIIGLKDAPLFELEFGTSKSGGDGVSRFREEARHMNQFIVHSSLDMVEAIQWHQNDLYLKSIDRFQNNHIFCYLTGGNVKFLLLMNADPHTTSYASYAPPSAAAVQLTNKNQQSSASRATGQMLAANPTSSQTEDAVRSFMSEVYELWIKHMMNPLYPAGKPISSPAFRNSVTASAKKHL